MTSRKRSHEESENGHSGTNGISESSGINGNSSINGKPKRQLILNAFVHTAPGHLAPGLWRHPRNKTASYNTLEFWTDLAKMLDAANFHALFIGDVLGGYDIYKGPANVGPGVASGAQFPTNGVFCIPFYCQI